MINLNIMTIQFHASYSYQPHISGFESDTQFDWISLEFTRDIPGSILTSTEYDFNLQFLSTIL